MKEKYVKEVAPALMEKFQYKSPMQIPKIDKIVVSVGCGDCKDNAKALGDKMIPDSGKKVVDEIFSMTEKYTAAIKEHASFDHLKSKIKKLYIRSIIRSNPSMTSDEYKEAFEDLKSSTK